MNKRLPPLYGFIRSHVINHELTCTGFETFSPSVIVKWVAFVSTLIEPRASANATTAFAEFVDAAFSACLCNRNSSIHDFRVCKHVGNNKTKTTQARHLPVTNSLTPNRGALVQSAVSLRLQARRPSDQVYLAFGLVLRSPHCLYQEAPPAQQLRLPSKLVRHWGHVGTRTVGASVFNDAPVHAWAYTVTESASASCCRYIQSHVRLLLQAL